MNPLEQQLKAYLDQTLGLSVVLSPWNGAAKLPAFLVSRYRFATMDLLDRSVLLVIDEAPDPDPPAAIRKHMDQLRAKWPGLLVYVRSQVTTYHRKRLIEQRVPFIVPGNQLYLTELGLDLREYFRTPPPSIQTFKPATQSVLIHLLLHRDEAKPTATALAPRLGYTAMTLSRVFDELESSELAETRTVGRERVLHFLAPPPETWRRAQPWLIDPVRSRAFIVGTPSDALHAGLDALARVTMLSEPPRPVFALSAAAWRSHCEVHPESVRHHADEADSEIEVWKYEPRAGEDRDIVDPLSLSLSLDDAGDERIEIARDEMLEQVRW